MSEITICDEARNAAYLEIRRYDIESTLDNRGKDVQLAIDSATSPLQKRIEELEAIANHHQNKYLHAVSVYEDEVKWLEKQLLAMREALVFIRSTRDMITTPTVECFYSATNKAEEALNSTPADLASKYSKREVLEKCVEALETVSRLPIARAYPDGPCLDREDMSEVNEALTIARKELETR